MGLVVSWEHTEKRSRLAAAGSTSQVGASCSAPHNLFTRLVPSCCLQSYTPNSWRQRAIRSFSRAPPPLQSKVRAGSKAARQCCSMELKNKDVLTPLQALARLAQTSRAAALKLRARTIRSPQTRGTC